MAIPVTLIEGDGIGPEVVRAAVRAIEATGAGIAWEPAAAGAGAVQTSGAPLPKETLEAIRRTRVALKGPLATPSGGGWKSVNVALRKEFNLYANVRPARSFEGVKTRFEGVDLIVIRENTQELYSGVEHFIDEERSAAESISIVTRKACERIVRHAFNLAVKRGRREVCLVHKANILKATNGLFLEVGREIAQAFPTMKFRDLIVDNCCMQLVREPRQFDVIVTTNLFGDIISDLTAGLIGGLGLTAGANIGERAAIFEAVHGTAPDIAGKGMANPTAVMLAGVDLLEHLGFEAEARRLERAVRAAIAAGDRTTPDLGGSGTTDGFANAVIDRLRA
jgi:isocitrate dehydrogenase (NAD+)